MIGSDVGNLQVGGTEVVTPLRHAMGFVDGNHPHFHLSEMLDETPLAQSLGRDIEELDAAADGVVEYCRHCVGRHAGCEAGGFQMTVIELLHLVFHQRYER